jgi:hypothetical protein
MRKMTGLLLAACLLAGPVRAAETPAAASCADDTIRGTSYDLGLTLQTMLPNRLEDFPFSLPIYGVFFGVPLFGHSLQAQLLYGSLEGLSLYTVELYYRYEFELPYFTPFLLAGGHFLHTSYQSRPQEYVGALAGLGLLVAMGRNFDLSLAMKIYLPKQSIVSFGGGFSFRL